MGPLSAQSLETELSVEEQDLMSQAQDDKYVSKYSDWRLIALDFKHQWDQHCGSYYIILCF